MANFLNDNINQSIFLDINYLEVLGDNTFEYCLYHLITKTLDLSDFDKHYKNSNVGRKAYAPAVLLRIIFYAYYRGITSSRVMALATGKMPHFTTIADFVSAYPEEIKSVFHKVLLICCKSGLVGGEHFAIDGCKLPSDASKQWSGTHADLKKKSSKLKLSASKIIQRHQSNDSDKGSGDKERELKTADTLIKNAKTIDEFLQSNEKRLGAGKRKQGRLLLLQNRHFPRPCGSSTK